ncbi:MAG: M20/M25/M40 family metallo-hydrolase [Nitrospirales bacterium]|nr:M20/M25/M40 family metallo-hydrolase [Nitrospirales bacterium]
MRKFLNFCLFVGILLTDPPTWGSGSSSSTTTESIAVERILQDIQELSHPKYHGRQAGTESGWKSAQYLVSRFRSLGLVPVRRFGEHKQNGTWFQQRPHTAIQLGDPAVVTLSPLDSNPSSMPRSLIPGQDFLPVLDSPSAKLTAPTVFVGYGIVDPARGVDDYRGIDANNRMVLFLRGKPSSYPRWVTHEEKAAIAQERGAVGYLTVTGPLVDRYEARKGLGSIPLAIYAASHDVRPIPGAWIHGKVLDQLLQATQGSLQALQQAANDTHTFQSMPLPILTHLHWESRFLPGTLTNVIGMLPGRDPKLRDEIILVGAHRDHFGKQAGLDFPGADDNASGTAVMLELAKKLSESARLPRRTILFVSFDGEERGLLGSTVYVSDPALPLGETVAMVNLDHLGVGNGNLTVGITRLDTTLVQQVANQATLGDKVKIYGFFPGGDHVPFYEAGVPTITIVSSGSHPHFHQSSDTFESVQPETLSTAAHFLYSLMTRLADPSH